MAWAQEIKNLVADIKTSHQDRTQYLAGVKEDTHELIARFQEELKEMAGDLKDFLAKSEATRIADFKGMMKDINADIDAIRKAVGTMLADYKAERKEAAGYWSKLKAKEVVEEAAPAAPKKKGGGKK